MKNTIKHLICSSLSGVLLLLSIFISLGLPELFGEAYRNNGDRQYLVYIILSIAVGILVYYISIKLAIHMTKEDKQKLYNELAYKPDNDLAYLIETGNIEAIKELYEVKQYDL